MIKTKTCKYHGELAEKDIRMKKDSRSKNRYYARCLICDREAGRNRDRAAEREKHVNKILKTMKRKKIVINQEYLDDRVIEGKRAQIQMTKTLLNK